MKPLARVGSFPTTHVIAVHPVDAIDRFKKGDLVQFGMYDQVQATGSMRSGHAQISHVDPTGGIHFEANLNCLVPAVAFGDYIFSYVRPCSRCRCEECMLRESQATRKMQAIAVGDDVYVKTGPTLAERVEEMRRLGVTKWTEGTTTIELGTEPAKADDKAETQQQQDPEALEKRRRAAMHTTSMSAVGRLVPRLGSDG